MMVDRASRPQARLDTTDSPTPYQCGRDEISSLVRIIPSFAQDCMTSFSSEKKWYPGQHLSKQVERVLNHQQFFQGNHAIERNIEQAIVSIVSALKAAIDKFDREKNLRDIRKRRYRAGAKVEKSNQSKKM